MPNCEDFRELISKYFDGELSADETAELNEHIAGCEDCSRFMNAYSLFLDSVPEDAEPPAELLSGVMSGVRAIKAKNKKRRRALIIRWTAAAASFALVIFAGLSLFRGGYKSRLRRRLFRCRLSRGSDGYGARPRAGARVPRRQL